MEKGITIFIPSYNEENNITAAVTSVVLAMREIRSAYEILIVDDGSIDTTYSVALGLTKKHKNIRVLKNIVNSGPGVSLQKALHHAKHPYFTVFPGDNDMAATSLRRLVELKGEADMIIAYMKGMKNRTVIRRILSCTFVFLMNRVVRLHLRYYTGPFICKTTLLRTLPLRAASTLIYAELKVHAIKKGHSYKEIAFHHIGRKHGRSNAISWKTLAEACRMLFMLWRDV